MNDFAELLGRQLAADLRALPRRVRAGLSPAGRPARAARAPRAGTISDLREAARRRMPRPVFDYLDGAAGDEVTAARNLAGLRAVEIAPRVLVDVSRVETATTVLGEPVALPLLGAPMGLAGLLHPAGEVALARAMHAAGSVYVLAAMASRPLEEVAAAAPGPLWFQMYIWRDRGLVHDMLRRAQASGMSVLVLTLDVPRAGGRDRDRRNGFSIPPRITMRQLAAGAAHPAWSYGFLRRPGFRWGNLPAADGPAMAFGASVNRQFDPSASWQDIAWFRDRWNGPLVVKGVLHPADARRAVDLGAAAVIVSNHGGRQLDGAPAAIRALPAIAAEVGGGAEVYVDGGIRRGADILKALALGARACLAGRALGYGLGAVGEAGARQAAQILHEELRTALALTGCPSVHQLDASWAHTPGSATY